MKITVTSMDASLEDRTVEVSDLAFGREYQPSLVHQVVVAYMAAARQGSVSQKSRSTARGGGRKPWRQKRLGKVRAGTIRSPIWRGGGVTFAASPRDYTQKVNRKMYRGAMRSILSELNRTGRLKTLDEIAVDAPKTRNLVALLDRIEQPRNTLVVHHEPDPNLLLSARNLPGVEVCGVGQVNPYALLAHDSVLLTEAALKRLDEMLS